MFIFRSGLDTSTNISRDLRLLIQDHDNDDVDDDIALVIPQVLDILSLLGTFHMA